MGLFTLGASLLASAAVAPPYFIDWFTINGGGRLGRSGLSGSIRRPTALPAFPERLVTIGQGRTRKRISPRRDCRASLSTLKEGLGLVLVTLQ